MNKILYHGSPKKLAYLRSGTYVTPYKNDARIFGVPWSSSEIYQSRSVSGRPPKKLRFKSTPPPDHPVYVYGVSGPTKHAKTNTGKSYKWNRVITRRLKVKMVENLPSWQDSLLVRRVKDLKSRRVSKVRRAK